MIELVSDDGPVGECAGAAACHGCLAWCTGCGDVAAMCDDPRCDAHAVACNDWEICRWGGHVADIAVAVGARPKCPDCGEALHFVISGLPWDGRP